MSTLENRKLSHQFDLRYGCNPHQKPAAIYALDGTSLPFEVLNGSPGYINLLDAMNAWQLVKELDQVLGLPAATSFKHVSPAGAAIAVPLNDNLKAAYGCEGKELSPLAIAYTRARGADPMSSFGDFIALSRTVDVSTAKIIKGAVSDGVIAPGYEPEALEILKAKKKGGYLILQADPNFTPPQDEFREVYGVGFSQVRNDLVLNEEHLFQEVVSQKKDLSEGAKRDLILSAITLKYTQSNSVGYALDGQMIGIGAGQQSRIDCTKLAGRKVELWYLRQHPKVLGLSFKPKTSKVNKTNARVAYVEGDMTPKEIETWKENFQTIPEPLTQDEKEEWLRTLTGVSLNSDAFFPFRDNIDQASKRGVSYVMQPGGSMRDEDVIQAIDEYGMAMVFSKTRLFHH